MPNSAATLQIGVTQENAGKRTHPAKEQSRKEYRLSDSAKILLIFFGTMTGSAAISHLISLVTP